MTLEEYLGSMKGCVTAMSWRRVGKRSGGSEMKDLVQESMGVLWEVWARYGDAVSDDVLRKIGTSAMRRHMISLYRKSQTRGAADVYFVDVSLVQVADKALSPLDRLEARQDVDLGVERLLFGRRSSATERRPGVLPSSEVRRLFRRCR